MRGVTSHATQPHTKKNHRQDKTTDPLIVTMVLVLDPENIRKPAPPGDSLRFAAPRALRPKLGIEDLGGEIR